MTIEQNKNLIDKYPFLQPRNVWTDTIPDDYDYSYILGVDELPIGWQNIFLQMCEDLKKQLIKDNQLHTFRFSQIKEKYNRMECYNNGCSAAAQRIIDKYSHLASNVCIVCGKVACWETKGYYASFCDDCLNKYAIHNTSEFLNHPITQYRLIVHKNGKKYYKTVSFLREWKRYVASLSD